MSNIKNSIAPRTLDPAKTFEGIVDWIKQTAERERAPGLIIGISGTDSILAYLACAEAFKRLGKEDRVLGIHYCPDNDEPANMSAEFNWVIKDIYPWLKEKTPGASLERHNTQHYADDNLRWGHLFSRAVRDTNAGNSLTSDHYFPVGTRNATEDYLGTYSQLSKSVSIQPIIHLYKSEVLQLCQYLGVPDIALDKSREIDCDCGRFDVAAHHIEEIDAFIMKEKGILSPDYIKTFEPSVRAQVMEYVLEEKHRNSFREATPYKPEIGPIVTMEVK